MRTSKFTESQMMAALKQADAGMSVNDISRQAGISPATFYKWRVKYGGLEASELSSLPALEANGPGILIQISADDTSSNAAKQE